MRPDPDCQGRSGQHHEIHLFQENYIAGSPTVFIDGLPAARSGDAIDCGGVV
ncbi:PAAR domain-containing protein, partial [Citrobacter cronae]|nr:PAAR domain-containing protein [Citrobacter cronae]